MQDIVVTEQGQLLFDFLDNYWSVILVTSDLENHGKPSSIESLIAIIKKTIIIENEDINFEGMSEGELEDIIDYFVKTGNPNF